MTDAWQGSDLEVVSMEAMGSMRDLEQIRERDEHGDSSRLLLVAVCGLAAACVLFALGIWIGRDGEAPRPTHHEDPLARLDALAGQGAPTVAAVTAPPATDNLGAPALVEPAAAEPESAPTAAPIAHVAAAAPVAALVEPDGNVREHIAPAAALPVAPANSVRLASTATASPSGNAPAPAGSDGAFTLQISSFRTIAGAQGFAQRLRERGYRAFVTTAPGSSGIVWHRVRIGPFATLHEAQRYRAEFESRERLPTFVVRRDEAPGHSG